MAIYDMIRHNIMRQELQLLEAGQHYKVYSARVKYLPENIENPEFFKLCYGMLTKCDEITVHTFKKDTYDIVYKFIVTNVSLEEKTVEVRQIAKIDFNNKPSVVIDAIDDMTEKTEIKILSVDEIKVLLGEETAKLTELIADLNNKVTEVTTGIAQYQTETDDQLEEIETRLEGVINAKENIKTAENSGQQENTNTSKTKSK